VMKNFAGQTVWSNSACHLYHLGDEVLGLEWNTKLGTIGGEVLEGIQRGIGIAEEKYKALSSRVTGGISAQAPMWG